MAPQAPTSESISLPNVLMRIFAEGVVLAAIVWLSSGRVDWIRGWAYTAFILLFQMLGFVQLSRHSPDLLAERMRIRKGTKTWDRFIEPAAAAVAPLVMLGLAGWDVRFHWPPLVPWAWSAAAFALSVISCVFTLRAMLANRFFVTTVRIQTERGHRVVDSGPYGYVRHPGYTGIILFNIASPVALGSWLALIPAAIAALLFILRTALEDRTLRAELEGYQEYAGRVRYRLVPGLW